MRLVLAVLVAGVLVAVLLPFAPLDVVALLALPRLVAVVDGSADLSGLRRLGW